MMEYKVCFHMSYGFRGDNKRHHGKLHYTGNTLEEAVQKALPRILGEESCGAYCTSLWVMRGVEKGRNTKWKDYLNTPEGKGMHYEALKQRHKDSIREVSGRY